MITNLFSIFDPASSFLSWAWLALPLAVLSSTLPLWNSSSPSNTFNSNILSTLFNEISFTINKSETGVTSLILTTFLTILTLNFIALYPQTFSTTSHLTTTLPLSLTFWLAIVLFGWVNNTSHILSHLVPQGTPNALIAFIVLIELTSNLIRPITLCVRLTANLIAGHLLMTLLGNSLQSLPALVTPLALPAPLILTVLESAVACIQAYVFMTLITLYTTEVN